MHRLGPSAHLLPAIVRGTRRLSLAGMGMLFVGAAFAQGATGVPLHCRDLAQKYEVAKTQLVDRQIITYLAQAGEKGCIDLARQLLHEGGSVNARRREGDTALHHAARGPRPEIAALLLDAGADIELRDLSGATPLTIAIEAGRDATAQLLIKRGATLTNPGRSGATPLIAAAFYGRDRLVTLLLDRKVDPDVEDRTGKTALVYAAARGFTGIVRQLLDHGVDVNRRHANNLTALIWAAGHANDVPEKDGLATVELLLQRGAAIAAHDDRGQTAIMTAAELGRGAIIELLLAHGARIDVKDHEGKSALDLATPHVRKYFSR
jgi:uncharacterized protein